MSPLRGYPFFLFVCLLQFCQRDVFPWKRREIVGLRREGREVIVPLLNCPKISKKKKKIYLVFLSYLY